MLSLEWRNATSSVLIGIHPSLNRLCPGTGSFTISLFADRPWWFDHVLDSGSVPVSDLVQLLYHHPDASDVGNVDDEKVDESCRQGDPGAECSSNKSGSKTVTVWMSLRTARVKLEFTFLGVKNLTFLV